MIQEKICTKCKDVKPLSEFGNETGGRLNTKSECKECTIERRKLYERTKIGLISKMYYSQKHNSKTRNYPMPEYSKHELIEWLLSQSLFHELYKKWELSGFESKLTPSCDRNDDYKGYSLKRLSIMTWGENETKGNKDRINGINNKQNKAVVGIHKITGKIKRFHSIKEVKRKMNISHSIISLCCNSKGKSAGGYTWKFAKEKVITHFK